MVSPIIKALGAIVVGTPVAVVMGLTARSIRKQEDAAVPVVRAQESPLTVLVFSNYLDKRSHELLPPTSMKPGYVAYDFKIENRTERPVKGVHIELEDGDGDVVGAIRLGDVEAGGTSVFAAKKSWNNALESYRTKGTAVPKSIVTWRTPMGRRRAVSAVVIRRVLGEPASYTKQRRRERPPVMGKVMS